ncbi:PQQ-dependent catabolism-associated CXXCW motif protein [Paracoccus ravus]|uniref:PQQ-dependent catabolism-associated CXXCW motif protein n=1 Tax=Paracoccus ravus TaxID=2447760 RepID=UPI00106EE7E6|nr:PQQ-dependent catabolism-associated CXXCW motif protein [Paracoccus ravus]
MRLIAVLVLLFAGTAQAQPPEPQGYRGAPYRAEVPATLKGARVIGVDEAKALHEGGVPFLDVMPRQKRPSDLPEGTIWNSPPHRSIPGAVWLYDTGYDRLAPAEQARLEGGLLAATNKDKARPVVIFCKTDCWMSWNAAKRAVGMGYTGVIWFPEGSDGWKQAGGVLEPARAADP